MHTARGLTIAALSAFVLAGCASSPGNVGSVGGDQVDIRGEWTFVGGTDADGSALALSDFPVTMEFTSDNARVRTGCFSFDQPLDAGLDVTTIALASSPLASCLGLTDDETAAIESLATVTVAERDGNSLTLTGPKVELTFELVPAVSIDEIAGNWSRDGLILFGDTGVMTESTAPLTIGADGAISGSTGCADFSGTIAEVASGTNTISGLAFANDTCTAGEADIADTSMRAVLEGGFLIHLNDGSLSLLGSQVETTISYSAVA